MSTKWTTEQNEAITVRNCNTLVSAAAGSGKTAVLVQRVIDMVTDETNPVYINQLLIATFTNAAATEMKDRIYSALQRKIAENPDNSFLKEQLVLLGQAQISTIHSFCMNLIRENFHLLGIRHDFDIADEVRLSDIRKKAIEEVLENKYEEGDLAFYDTVDAFGGKKNDDNLSDIILSVYNFAESLPNPVKWLENCSANLKNNDFIHQIKNIMSKHINGVISSIVHEYEMALDVIENDADLSSYYDIYLNELNIFKEMLDENAENIKDKVDGFVFDRLPRKGKNADPISTDYVKKIRDNTKKQFLNICDICLYTDDEIYLEIEKMYPFVHTICSLVIEFRSIFASKKLADNLLDFNDLEHFAIKLLEENQDVRDYFKSFFKEIFVDEYQDTNGVQAYLFELLSNGKNLFMVGDVKQSIYGFRNSNPRYFIEKYNSYDFERPEVGRKINLAKNFRSSNGIINTVNVFFEKLMVEELGGVTYNKDHALVYGNDMIKDLECSIERYVINSKKSDNEDLEDEDTDKVRAEAIFVANRIHNLVEVQKQEIYDKNIDSFRNIIYKDIVILMRKTKNIASVYADVFADKNIPVYTAESGGYFNCVEIATIMSYLKIIENPLQDIPMLAVMRSPIFGFDDNLIANIRAENRNTHIYTLLKKSKEKSVVNFINEIEKLREFAKYNNIGAVIRKIVFDTGYYQFVGGLSNGEVRMMNLKLLCERANTFSQKGFKNISHFISYVNSMIEGDNEYSSPKLISENDNVVNIMSIHKSKGLEFPVVFLCESGLLFNKMDLSKPYVFDEKLGMAMNIVDVKRRLKYVPYVKKAICEKKKDELIAEEIRLLYVAMTRAKYKLIISGTVAFSENIISDCTTDAYNIKLKKNYLDMLLTNVKGLPDAKVYSISEVLNEQVEFFDENTVKVKKNDYEEFFDSISKKLEFSYAYPDSKFVPSKRSISEMVSENDEINLEKICLNKKEITSAQKGTLIHFVLQNIDLKSVGSAEAVALQVDNMIRNGIFDEEYKKIIDIDAIYAFFISDIGKRMLKSDCIYREFKFCVDIPANELDYCADGETVLMQGVIDCCFLEDDGFVIIDYKTGSLKEKYKRQIELYKQCLEISTGKPVKETYIYPLI